jgi:hypothetical protein
MAVQGHAGLKAQGVARAQASKPSSPEYPVRAMSTLGTPATVPKVNQ